MNEWFKKLFDKIKELWAKWSVIQKVILFGIVAVVIVALVLIGNVSTAPTTVQLYSVAITDEALRQNIILELDNQNIETTVSADGKISVQDKGAAQRAKAILLSKGLQPSNVDPWEVFDTERWTITDMQQKTNLQRALTEQVRQSIESFSFVDRVVLNVSFPEKSLFASEQKPMTASVQVTPRPGREDDLSKGIKGIQNVVKYAFGGSGLTDENISITDNNGKILNDFDNYAEIEKVDVTAKQLKLVAQKESELRAMVLNYLQTSFSDDRVRDVIAKLEMDMSEETTEKVEYSPITIKEDNPDTPYDDSQFVETLPISSETVTKVSKGTAYNPEGVSGVEGQNPPVYSDMSNLYTITEEKGEKVNNVINTSKTVSKKEPKPTKATVSVNIDGTWKLKVDEKGNYVYVDNEGHREWEYFPIEPEELEQIRTGIQNAINIYPNASVSVTNIRFDRTKEHDLLDAEYAKAKQTQQTIIYVAIGIVAVLLAFILFRFINRQIEKKRKEKEAELLRRQQAEQDRILQAAEHESMEVTMSVEERERAELQEHAVSMAKEHPEDVAMLIRTWLMEE